MIIKLGDELKPNRNESIAENDFEINTYQLEMTSYDDDRRAEKRKLLLIGPICDNGKEKEGKLKTLNQRFNGEATRRRRRREFVNLFLLDVRDRLVGEKESDGHLG